MEQYQDQGVPALSGQVFFYRRYGHDRYNLNRTLDEIRPGYQFDESCQGTVPQAIIAFLESTDFKDAIRNAISLGGDSDTLTAITGSIAEAAYGVPQWIQDQAWGVSGRASPGCAAEMEGGAFPAERILSE